jgi:hypothetical protein
VFTALLALTGFTCVAHYAAPPEPAKKPLTPKLLSVLFLAGAAAAGAGLALSLLWGQGWGYMLVFPGAALVSFVLLSFRKAVREVKPPPPKPSTGTVPGCSSGPWRPHPLRRLALLSCAAP